MFSVVKHFLRTEGVACEVINSERYKKAYSAVDVEFKHLVHGIRFRDLSLGDGKEVVRGDVVHVQFKGRLLGGREIESTEALTGNKLRISAGGDDVVKAVSEGVIGMREYGSRELLVPPRMHYPDRFPNQIMIYEILVRSVDHRDS